MGVFDNLFGKKESAQDAEQLEWLKLTTIDELDDAIKASYKKTVMLFKHSTRCSISSSAINRLTRNWKAVEVNVDAYYLDLIAHRDVSSAIATKLNVPHQSPQMILVKDGAAIFNASHMEIDFNSVKEHASVD